MDYNGIRLRILNFLYQKHFAGQPMHYFEVDEIIRESGLENENRNVIDGNTLYLYDKKLVAGTRSMGVAAPTSLYITASGIDFVEYVYNNTIQKMTLDQRDTTELQQIEREPDHPSQIRRFFTYVLLRPELIKSYINTIVEEMGKYGHHVIMSGGN